MTRDEALNLIKTHLHEDHMVKHSLATEAIMRALAQRLGEDVERWGITGLLHDLDFETTREQMSRHGPETVRMLGDKIDADMAHAIMAHNEATGTARQSQFDHALTCAESVTGMVVATALVYPDRKIASVKTSSVTKRMKQPAFARAVNRDNIKECEKLGLTLDEFVALSVTAMGGIASELGL